jgi:hypothetical protein
MQSENSMALTWGQVKIFKNRYKDNSKKSLSKISTEFLH